MILQALTDNDLYKFTMQQAILEQYPDAVVTYRFRDRNPGRRLGDVYGFLKAEINKMESLYLSHEERDFMHELGFFKPQYLEYLRSYSYDSDAVTVNYTEDRELEVEITDYWHKAVLWEVPLMATISQIYFENCDMNWDPDLKKVKKKAKEKGKKLNRHDCFFADFGTRRRRSFHVQEAVVQAMKSILETESYKRRFVGTSNVYLAMLNKVKPIGTMAHEWIMGVSALEGLRHANRFALDKWADVYQGNLGIALTDTFGTGAFWDDFDTRRAKLWDGPRHDSGDPIEFVENAVKHYEKLSIDPSTKTIVFSDGLDVETAIKIREYCKDRIGTSFGIGTHLTNDFEGSPALNMVIKLDRVNNIPVVKLSDEPGKEVGDCDAVRVAKWTFSRKPLDEGK